MVGVSLALQLAAVLPQDKSICLVEGFPLPQPVVGGTPDYHPSFDARSTALSYSSRLIYEKIGVWEELLQWLCPIESIHVSSRGRFGSSLLLASDHNWSALGYVVENAWLGNALIQALHRQGRVEMCSPARVIGAQPNGKGVSLQLEGEVETCIDAGLLLVADGASSGLREQLGVAVQEKPYGQHALVANISFAQAHKGCAYERFTDSGPLAFLPMQGNRCSVVWTLRPEQAESLKALDEETFLAQLQERFGFRLGQLKKVGVRQVYPLSLQSAAQMVQGRVVIIGNAAHSVHPVAGQGFNLALRDISLLSEMVADAHNAGADIGQSAMLQRYALLREDDVKRVYRFTDTLIKTFSNAIAPLAHLRSLSLLMVDLVPDIKHQLANQSMGLSGRLTRLARGLRL